jgi:Ran GTPase-activating protein (RanGAP) involved in mRNA processing and transport
MDSVRCLSRSSLRAHTFIQTLDLAHCDLGSSPEILSAMLPTDIEFIILDNNNIDSLGADKIAEYLEGDPPVVRIDLDCNRLNDDDAMLISQALMRNTNLRTISLHSNNFTSIGVKALLNCVFESSSLNAISASNHTMVGMNIFLVASGHNLEGCIEKMLVLDRTQKVMLALQDQDFQLQYLANIPVKLMPEVLAFPL